MVSWCHKFRQSLEACEYIKYLKRSACTTNLCESGHVAKMYWMHVCVRETFCYVWRNTQGTLSVCSICHWHPGDSERRRESGRVIMYLKKDLSKCSKRPWAKKKERKKALSLPPFNPLCPKKICSSVCITAELNECIRAFYILCIYAGCWPWISEINSTYPAGFIQIAIFTHCWWEWNKELQMYFLHLK